MLGPLKGLSRQRSLHWHVYNKYKRKGTKRELKRAKLDNGLRESWLTGGEIEVLPVDWAVIAVKEELLPVRHRLTVALDALLVMGVPGSEVEEPWGPAGKFQLEEPAQLQGRHPHPMVDVIEDVEADRHAVGVGGELHGGDLIEVPDLQDERMKDGGVPYTMHPT